jgi:hypothetical protein
MVTGVACTAGAVAVYRELVEPDVKARVAAKHAAAATTPRATVWALELVWECCNNWVL